MSEYLFERITPGSRPPPVSARLHNTLATIAERYLQESTSFEGHVGGNGGTGLVLNTTGGNLDQLYVVKITDPAIEPDDNADEFISSGRVIFEGTAATTGDRFAILLAPIRTDSIGPAMVMGVTPCRVKSDVVVGDTLGAETGRPDRLQQSAAGAAVALWVGATVTDGCKWAIVAMGHKSTVASITVDDANASDITYNSGTGVLNVPNAGVSQRGAVNATTQTIMGVKTLVETDGATFNTASLKLGNEATNYGGTGYGTLMFSTAGEGTISLGGGGLEGIFTMAAVVTDDNGGSAYTPSVAFLNLLPRQSVSGGLASTRTLALLTGRYSTTTDFDTVESQPSFAVTSAVGNRHIGQWATVAGLSFSGGLLTGGSLSLSGVSITGTTGTIDGGTW